MSDLRRSEPNEPTLFRFPAELKHKIRIQAINERKSMSKFVGDIVEEYFAKKNREVA